MPRAIALFAAMFVVTGCGHPTEVEQSRQDLAWADETDWRGTVTMKTATVFAVGFHLSIGSTTRGFTTIYANPARIENELTGIGGLAWVIGSSVRKEEGSVSVSFFNPTDLGIDGEPPLCPGRPPAGPRGSVYEPSLNLTKSGLMTGTLRLVCLDYQNNLDLQVLEVRRK